MELATRNHNIELLLQWQGELKARDFAQLHHISYDSAKRHIQSYSKAYPNQINYNPQRKCHEPTAHFSAQSKTNHFDQYIALIEQQKIASSEPDQNNSLFNAHIITQLTAPARYLQPSLIRKISQACKYKQRLEVDYLSLTNPDYEGRIIQPHTFVNDGQRWHVRAYDEKSQQFKDFNLARFKDQAQLEGPATTSIEADTAWNTFVDIIITTDPRLSAIQKQCIEQEYQMQQGRLVIPCRIALINYLLLKLRIDTYKPEAIAQQIILDEACRKALKPHLWRG